LCLFFVQYTSMDKAEDWLGRRYGTAWGLLTECGG
jgi:hypothetical protein